MVKISRFGLKINQWREVKKATAGYIAGLVDYIRVMLNFV